VTNKLIRGIVKKEAQTLAWTVALSVMVLVTDICCKLESRQKLPLN